MTTNFKHRDILAIHEFTKDEILHILDHTQKLKSQPRENLLDRYILGSCFYEPSTRTRLSFESAMHRLGGKVIGFSSSAQTSTAKGESLHDSMKMLEGYADVVVLRHPLDGAARLAAEAIHIPVINAGDGANQHPTQTFLDLFSIRESQGTLENLSIAFVGDLKYGRTVHSLAEALVHFNARLYFISETMLEMPEPVCELLRSRGIKFSFHQYLDDILPKVDIVYMTRIQEERFSHKLEFEGVKTPFCLTVKHLKRAKPNLKIFHPLPRVNEIDPQVDDTPHAYYFQQAQNGLYTRQAILGLVLGELL